MKRTLLFCSLLLLSAVGLHAEDITKTERSEAIKYLEKTRAGVLEATKGLSEAQWQFKPAPEKWSVAEVTEHIAAAEDFLMNMVKEKVMSAPPRPDGDDVKAIDTMILEKVPDRSKKVQASEPLHPSNRFGSPKESLKHFQASRGNTIEFLKKTQDLRMHAVDSPFGKKFDAYEWVLMVAAHSDRHTKQIAEVKADPNFPKK
jgi:hypothetical protein